MRHYSPTTILVLVLIIPSAYSESDQDQHIQELYSLPLEALLQITVKSSTLTNKKIKTVPSAVTIFTREQIRNLGADYLHELINFVPGFQAYRQGESSAEYFHSSRGHRSSTKSREVLILIDGVRLNREFDNALSIPMLPLYNIEKIEFIRGPGSALYGSNAVLGVIDITTVRNKNQIQFSLGENNQNVLTALGSTSLSDWHADIALHLFDDAGSTFTMQDFYTQTFNEVNDPLSGKHVQLRLQKNLSELSVLIVNREAEDFYTTERISPENNLVSFKHEQYRFDQGVNWNNDFTTNITLMYSENTYAPESDFGPTGLITANIGESNSDLKIHNQWTYKNKQNLIFGLDFRQSSISEFLFKTENYGDILIYPDSTREIFSSYIQNEYKFERGSELTLGARYDYYDGIGSSLSPRIGYVKPLNSNQTLKILYGQAFRAPTVNELFLENTGEVVGNANLNPETIETWEIIWINQWKQHIFSLNTFYNTVNSLISRDESLTEPTFINQKNPEFFYGYEIEYSVQLADNWLLNINASKFQNLPELDFRQADTLASFTLNYSREDWNWNISGNYSDERQFLTGTTQQNINDYWLANSKWQYRLNNRYEIYVQARNIFDENYLTPTQRNMHSEAIPNRGRELSLGIQIQF